MKVPELILIDVGCSGGIEPIWKPYSAWLRGYGIDPLSNEIDRLNRENPWPNVEYHAGSVVGPELKTPPAYLGWFDRVSAMAAHKILDIDYVNQVHNSGLTPSKSEQTFTLDEFCRDRGLTRVDFLKTDTDGHEYAVLGGGQKTLSTTLGAVVEVMFCVLGEADAVFRDIDGCMAQQGLYLA